jgi:hypothetical protein
MPTPTAWAFLLPSLSVMKSTWFTLVLLGVLLCGSPAFADKTDFQVNDNAGTSEQNNPRIAVAADGSFVIAWIDKRAGENDIYLQRFASDGTALGHNRKINTDTNTAWQADPAIASDLSGLVSLVWRDYRNGLYPFDADIYFQRFDSAVVPSGTNLLLTTELPDSLKEAPDIALSPWGGGVVVWADYREANWDIYGQIFAADGSLIGGNFKVNDDVGTAQQHAPRVTYSSEGWLLVTWYDNRLGSDDIFARRFDSLGGALGANVLVNSDGSGKRQAFPDVAADGAGHFTVVWVDWRNGNYPANPDIYARRFDTTMVPLTQDKRINTDNSLRAQREPTIAADRMGNVAVIWSDSVNVSFDIMGQMIDVDGEVREFNFQANSFSDSAQLKPDVALDGRYRYVTWADKRNGNYDIYASIAQYNDPTMVVAPVQFTFTMEQGGSLPAAQALVVESYGYNPVSFDVASSVAWLSTTPGSGQTPETLQVSIVDAGLSYGSHFGSLTLLDSDNLDSSVIISVRVDVTAPIIDVTPDSIMITGLAGYDDARGAGLTVTNDGSGSFAWTALSPAAWVLLGAGSGVDGDTVSVFANAATLTVGSYPTVVVFSAPAAENEADTVVLIFDVVDTLPYLAVIPESIFVRTDNPALLDTSIIVTNPGTGSLAWTAAGTGSWLNLTGTSGGDGDSVRLALDTAVMVPGIYRGTITITDSSTINKSVDVPVVVDYFAVSADSLIFGSALVQQNQSGSVFIDCIFVEGVHELVLPIRYDTSLVAVDSVACLLPLPATAEAAYETDGDGILLITVSNGNPDSIIAAGSHTLAEIYFTATATVGSMPLDTALVDTLSAVLIRGDGYRVTPGIVAGMITVDYQTAVGESDPDGLPEEFALGQNFPNPFNLTTTIEFAVPEATQVKLELFNILGQRVVSLVDAEFSAGRYTIFWDGRTERGVEAATGIYFYRLRAGSANLVRKMLLLK